ncbi:MAG: tetratricopeptide repeat protein [Holosporales bacterium]
MSQSPAEDQRQSVKTTAKLEAKQAAEEQKTPRKKTNSSHKTTPPQPVASQEASPQQAPLQFASETIVASLVDQDESALEIGFKWRQNVQIALFSYGGRIWLIFDKPGKVDLKDIPQGPTQLIKHIAVVSSDKALGIVFEARENTGFYLDNNERGWVLGLQQNVYYPPEANELSKPNYEFEPKAYAWLKTLENPTVVQLGDGATATTLHIIPTPPDIAGEKVSTPDFDTVKTYRGLAIVPKRDGLQVVPGKEAVFIQAETPLNFARKEDLDPKRQRAVVPQLVRLEKWGEEKENYGKVEYRLRQAAQKDLKGRLRLARFYLAHARSAEAIGMLNLAAREAPAILSTPEFVAARAIALALARRTDEAIAIAGLPILENEPEIRLWQGYLKLQKEDLSEGVQIIVENLYLLQKLPPLLRNEISRESLRAMSRLRGPGHVFLDMYQLTHANPYEREELILRRALLEYNNDRKVEGDQLLERALKSPFAAVRVEANLVDLQRRPVDRDMEIRKLEDVRYDWRRNLLEKRLLQRLAQLYLDKEDVPAALRLLRQLMTYFEDTETQNRAKTQVHEAIASYLQNEKHQDPFSFVKFISEFDDLMPEHGSEAANLALRAADKYAELGLRPKAQQYLMRALALTRDQPQSQAQILQSLAHMHAASEEYEKALSYYDQALVLLPNDPELMSQRRLTLAKIKEKAGQLTQAAETLKDDGSEESLNLQLQLFWRDKKWDQVTAILQQLIKMREDNKALTPDLVLNLAVAYDHAGQPEKLSELRERYGDLMNKSSLKAPFDILTSPIVEASSHDRKRLLEQLAQTKQLRQQAETAISKIKAPPAQ